LGTWWLRQKKYSTAKPSRSKCSSYFFTVPKEIRIGEFSLTEENHLSYFHYMNVSNELVTPQWVTEMLLAGLSLIHHYHALDPLLINTNKKK
jgi:hypothetical protein